MVFLQCILYHIIMPDTNSTPDAPSSQASQQEMIDRVKHLMQIRHLSQRQLAALLRIDASNFSKVMNGRIPFSEGLVNRMVVDLGVSKAWLRDGHGLPFDKTPLARDISLREPLCPGTTLRGTPVYDLDVTAGCRSLEAIFGEVRPVGTIDMPELSPQSNVVKVSGNSMAPRIVNGGYVAIRRISSLRNIFWGQIYVVELDEMRLVKYLRRHSDPAMVILHSANPDYDDMDVARDDIRALYLVEAILNYEAR